MQFGKMHGIALAVLGTILLGIQGMHYLPTKSSCWRAWVFFTPG